MNIDNLLAGRTRKMSVNTIREILKVVAQPGMVSLAGGIPADAEIEPVEYDDLDHVQIMRGFLNHPERYLGRLFDQG